MATPEVGLFWDYENIKRPRAMDTYTVCTKLREFFRDTGRLCERRLYYDSRKQTELATDREGFDMSGFTLVDCPTRRQKEAIDKKIIVDVMSFAWQHLNYGGPPPVVVLLSSDGDYAYMLNRLRDFGVRTALVYGCNAHAALIKSADETASWRFEVLGMVEPRCPARDVADVGSPAPCAGRVASGGTPKSAAARERYLVLLVAMQAAQMVRVEASASDDWRECWAYDADVGGAYHRRTADALDRGQRDQRDQRAQRRAAYKLLRAGAHEVGLIALGTRRADGAIDAAKDADGAGTVMVRLTERGAAVLAGQSPRVSRKTGSDGGP